MMREYEKEEREKLREEEERLKAASLCEDLQDKLFLKLHLLLHITFHVFDVFSIFPDGFNKCAVPPEE